MVGTVGLLRFDFEHRHAELGYDIARRWWGRGLTPKAAGTVIRYGFSVRAFTGSRQECCPKTTPRCGCSRSSGRGGNEARLPARQGALSQLSVVQSA